MEKECGKVLEGEKYLHTAFGSHRYSTKLSQDWSIVRSPGDVTLQSDRNTPGANMAAIKVQMRHLSGARLYFIREVLPLIKSSDLRGDHNRRAFETSALFRENVSVHGNICCAINYSQVSFYSAESNLLMLE